jgi:hypothetical protein
MRRSKSPFKMDFFDVLEAAPETVAQGADAFRLGAHLQPGDAEGLAHADDLVGGQGAGAHAALVAAAVHLGFQADPGLAPHVEGADALGAVGLVGREGHQVDLQLLQVDLHLAGAWAASTWNSTPLERHSSPMAGMSWMTPISLLTNMTETRIGVRTEGGLQFFQVDEAVGLDPKVGDFKAFPFQFPAGVQHRLVLGLDGDEVLALALIEAGGALDGQVVGLGGAGSPDDLLGVGVDQGRHMGPGFLHRLVGIPAEDVGT